MRYKEIRQFNFPLHRYIGLFVGIILAIVGLTGSALVFQHELDRAIVSFQYGSIVPQAHRLAPELVLNQVKTNYRTEETIAISSIDLFAAPNSPDRVKIKTASHEAIEVFVNPYTGDIMGDRQENTLMFKWIHKLHDSLLIGKMNQIEVGKIIVGIAAFLFLALNLTGVVLWDGWRKISQGFSIKWQAKPLRVNYDIHKFVGIIAVIFLIFTAFTGFIWNFKLDRPIANFLTFSGSGSSLVKLESTIDRNRPTLSITQILEIADTALPGAVTTKIKLPETSHQVFKVHKKFPQEHGEMGHSWVAIDPYSGNLLEVKNGLNLPPYRLILNIFEEIHYGTFAGWPSRTIYLLVGISPLVLFVTSLVMYSYRRPKLKVAKSRD